jgi:superfamily II DNA or RNA helicase
MNEIKPGLYEAIITQRLSDALKASGLEHERAKLGKNDAPALLAQFLNALTIQTLESVDEDDERTKQLEVVNAVLATLERFNPLLGDNKVEISSEFLQGVRAIGRNVLPIPPSTPLSQSALFTGAAAKPQLSNELLAEMRSADRVDILVSFIKNSGLRILEEGFKDLRNRNIPVRIITTTYMGATDAEAIERLSAYPNVEIKVSYDTNSTRLHAKAYYFERASGFSTAYVGSSNMSNPAMTGGLEWNLKATQSDLPNILRAFEGEFGTYWNDPRFQTYQEQRDSKKLRDALIAGRTEQTPGQSTILFDITPRAYQQRILDTLEAERSVRGSYRNLLVAATGTGKTVISAFDYKAFCDASGGTRPKLLFLAHREEILNQSLQTFRHVLKDAGFGELMGGSAGEAQNMDQLFCTVQTAQSRRIWEKLGRNYYDFIVVDEAHHSAANTYTEILGGFDPKILLGMTATPERMDGDSILPLFNNQIAAELRLPEALEEKLLCPFQYFCVADPVSLADNSFWEQGKYKTSALEKAYVEDNATANQRLGAILSALERYSFGNIGGVKGLGFCVSIKHAEFMAKSFNEKQIPSIALTSLTNDEVRKAAIQRLRSGDLKFIFTVDLFNEGVDIPEANLVLFLRPTDSLTVFLQQLGRGLRHAKGKECLVVLDFVAQMHKKYRVDRKFAALLSGRRFNIKKEVESGFPHVPAGCSIQLEAQAMEQVVANIKAAYSNLKNYVKETVATFEKDTGKRLTFGNYIHTYEIDPARLLDVKSWSAWKNEALGLVAEPEPDYEPLKQAAERIAQATGPNYLKVIKGLPQSGLGMIASGDRTAIMLHGLIWQKPGNKLGMNDKSDTFNRLKSNPRGLADIAEVAEYKLGITNTLGLRPYADLPLELHAHYGNDEIQAAFGRDIFSGSGQKQTGVLPFHWCKAYALLITLNKSEKDFSPSTMYRDYIINRELVHWESQSNTTQKSESGQNLINHAAKGYSIHLFVRSTRTIGPVTAPFQYLGKAEHVEHKGECPISFIWKLEHLMPGELLEGGQ